METEDLNINKPTEQKIKEAALKLFAEKGFDATKTRDIAHEAGTNLALVNYYFGSKEQLFDIAHTEMMSQFMRGIAELINDPATTWQQKLELLVERYIDNLIKNPQLPVFVLTQGKQGKEISGMRDIMLHSLFLKQMKEAEEKGAIEKTDPLTIIMNLVGLTIFPFIARQLFLKEDVLLNEHFEPLMQMRKSMIPLWIHAMLAIKNPTNFQIH